MGKLLIDDKAIEFLMVTLDKENAPAVRIFTGGGGCCQWFEFAPVKKSLPGDVAYNQDGITLYIEKGLVENAKTIEIKFEKENGLRIEFKEQNNKRESLNKINSQ